MELVRFSHSTEQDVKIVAGLVMDQRVRAAIAYMRDNLHRRVSLGEIANAAQLSPVHLRRVFKRETNMPPVQFLGALRIRRAKELLESSSLSVKEIAAEVGTGDVSHFVRNFEKTTGLPPTRHRARYHQNRREKTTSAADE